MSAVAPAPIFPAVPDRNVPHPAHRLMSPLAAGASPSRLNAVFGVLLVVIVAIAPLPLGSNRPIFWSFWAVAIGLLAVAYGIGLVWLRARARRSLADYWPEAIAVFMLLGWLGIQLLPLGQWLPTLTVPVLGERGRSISLDPGSTRLTLLTFATYGLLFVLFSQVAVNRRRARGMLLALFLVIACLAGYSLVSLSQLGDTLLGFEKLYYAGSATGTFINRNSFATFLASGLAIGVPLLADGLGRFRGAGQLSSLVQVALVLLGLLFVAAALLATGSRMGIAAGTVGALAALALALPWGGPRRPWLWLGLALLAAFAIIVTIAIAFGADALERFIFVSDATGRAELYPQIWHAILQRPWFGYGGGSFATVFPMFQHAPLAGDTLWDRAHSTYLALWFELGLVAGSLPLLLVAALLVRAMASLADSSSRSLSIAAIAVTIVFALHSLVDFGAEMMANAFLFTAILALGAAGGRRMGER